MVTAQLTTSAPSHAPAPTIASPRQLTTKSGDPIPSTINQQTDFNVITTAMTVYYKRSGCLGSFATALLVADAMRDASAVVALYVALDGEQQARVLWPQSVTLSKDAKIVARCYCTLRKQFRSFRLDRVLSCHELTTPDDATD